jgi:hypothetical protein
MRLADLTPSTRGVLVAAKMNDRILGTLSDYGFTSQNVESMVSRKAITDHDDVVALTKLAGHVPTEELLQWFTLGACRDVVPLVSTRWTFREAKSVIQASPNAVTLAQLIAALRETGTHRIAKNDLPQWVRAGVVVLDHIPHVNSSQYEEWQTFAEKYNVPMSNCAVAAAAGFSPTETAVAVQNGTFDVLKLQLMTALRSDD